MLRDEALTYRDANGATCFGSRKQVAPEKAVVANCAAVRELDANGTNFGYNPRTGDSRGEFGHNDYYPVVVAAAQIAGWDGRQDAAGACSASMKFAGGWRKSSRSRITRSTTCCTGRLPRRPCMARVLGATAEQIESAIGMVVAHYVPFRAIRHGEQLSDSKGASAAISAEVGGAVDAAGDARLRRPGRHLSQSAGGVLPVRAARKKGDSPFDLELATGGDDFAVMGMHFKLGLYEHQSAGAIEGLIELLASIRSCSHDANAIDRIGITIYEPAFSIIGDPHKRDPRTRQSADHSMVYIIATLLRKGIEPRGQGTGDRGRGTGNGGRP